LSQALGIRRPPVSPKVAIEDPSLAKTKTESGQWKTTTLTKWQARELN